MVGYLGRSMYFMVAPPVFAYILLVNTSFAALDSGALAFGKDKHAAKRSGRKAMQDGNNTVDQLVRVLHNGASLLSFQSLT